MDRNVSWLCLRVQEVGAVDTPSINQNFSEVYLRDSWPQLKLCAVALCLREKMGCSL